MQKPQKFQTVQRISTKQQQRTQYSRDMDLTHFYRQRQRDKSNVHKEPRWHVYRRVH